MRFLITLILILSTTLVVFAQVDLDIGKKIQKYKEDIEKLKKELENSDPIVRADAALALGVIKNPEVIPFVRKLLKDVDENVRSSTINSLCILQDKGSRNEIIKLGLYDKFGIVRASAASGLGTLQDKIAIPALKTIAKHDKESMVRITAAISLKSFGEDWAISIIRETIKDRNLDVRIYAAAMLSSLGDLSCVPIVRQGLSSKDKTIRGACVNVLGQVGGEDAILDLKYISKNDEEEIIRDTARNSIRAIEARMKKKTKE
ncbi:MAG: HEAT repeat domain-containing protein [Candidatus Firestonebacteria bacterium]